MSVDSVARGLAVPALNSIGSGPMTNPMTTLGDTIYGGASGIPTRLGIGSVGQVLTVSGGAPAWGAPSVNNSNWSGTALAIGNGGTGQTSALAAFNALSPMTAAGDLIIGGTSGSALRLAKGTDTYVLTMTSGSVGWAAPSGGSPTLTINTTATSGATAGQILYSDGSNLQATSAVGAAFGGTGVSNNAANTLTFSGNYGLTFTLGATTALTLPASGTLISTAVTSTLAAGYTVTTPYDYGTQTTGTTTLDATKVCKQKMNCNGTITLAPQSAISTIELEVTMGASAIGITTSGYSKVVGSFDYTSTHVFQCISSVSANKSILYIQAAQ